MTNVVDMKPKRLKFDVGSGGSDWWKQERKPGEEVAVKKRRRLSERYFSVKSLAERLGCSEDVLYDDIKAGTLVAEPVGSRLLRISEEAAVDYLNRPRMRRAR